MSGSSAGGNGSGGSGGGGVKRVFVTADSFGPAMIDNAGTANALCQQSALLGSLGGSWQAWVSDDLVDAKDNVTGPGPWVRLDGAPVFTSHAELTGMPGTPENPITIAEDMSTPPVLDRVWTGTQNGGVASEFCSIAGNDWVNDGGIKGTAGVVGQINNWTDTVPSLACNGNHHLYCFEL
jgi:hypothetical protein